MKYEDITFTPKTEVVDRMVRQNNEIQNEADYLNSVAILFPIETANFIRRIPAYNTEIKRLKNIIDNSDSVSQESLMNSLRDEDFYRAFNSMGNFADKIGLPAISKKLLEISAHFQRTSEKLSMKSKVQADASLISRERLHNITSSLQFLESFLIERKDFISKKIKQN